MAVAALSSRLRAVVHRLRWGFEAVLGRGPDNGYPDAFCLVGAQPETTPSIEPFSLKDLIGDGFLWGVPKHRRSLEKRMKRRFGSPQYELKILQPKGYLRTCNVCGDDYETGCLCPTCYKKVIDETKAMQDAIQEELKLEPVEKEVLVLYEGERDSNPKEFYEGKRIVEVKRPRPAWFSRNLLQGSTQKPAQTGDVKPSDLG